MSLKYYLYHLKVLGDLGIVEFWLIKALGNFITFNVSFCSPLVTWAPISYPLRGIVGLKKKPGPIHLFSSYNLIPLKLSLK